MSKDRRIAFIGAGNMASALIQGLLARGSARADSLIASDVEDKALRALSDKYGIVTTRDNTRACQAEIIVLSVKPQVLPAVLPELAPHVGPDTLVVSIAAGVPIAVIESQLPGRRVVRAMPNTPALVGAGATAVAAGSGAGAQDLASARAIFESVGVVVEVAEELLDAVTALSGSGPAYVFYLAESLLEAGREVGLSDEVARALALQTVYGSAKLLHESGEAPADLRRKVTSPNGTTEAGVKTLEALRVREAFRACVTAARDRGRELGREVLARLKPR
ncbi:MAG TPA: pyrroline-5-carboxylate reductase [Polyangiales bacterium]|nr:pyrroline-5-carboxylate reductase [Polyangiales bacterium]